MPRWRSALLLYIFILRPIRRLAYFSILRFFSDPPSAPDGPVSTISPALRLCLDTLCWCKHGKWKDRAGERARAKASFHPVSRGLRSSSNIDATWLPRNIHTRYYIEPNLPSTCVCMYTYRTFTTVYMPGAIIGHIYIYIFVLDISKFTIFSIIEKKNNKCHLQWTDAFARRGKHVDNKIIK